MKKRKAVTRDDYDAKMMDAVLKNPILRKRLNDPKIRVISKRTIDIFKRARKSLFKKETK